MKVFFIFIINSLIALSVSYPFEESDTMKALVEKVVENKMKKLNWSKQSSRKHVAMIGLGHSYVYIAS